MLPSFSRSERILKTIINTKLVLLTSENEYGDQMELVTEKNVVRWIKK